MKSRTQIIRLIWLACLLAATFSVPQASARQNDASMTPKRTFLLATKDGDLAKVREMLKSDPALASATTAKGVSAVLIAIYNGHKEIADLLLSTGIELNIFEAVATGRVERVRALLKAEPSLINSYSPDGWTPLHLANFGHKEMTKLLLDAGADIDAVAKNGFKSTPLQGAAAFKELAIARLLIERGANVNPRGEGGYSPLHEAAGTGQMELAKLLLAHGADVNAKGDDGKTPLTIALENKQTEMANLLRARKAIQ